jgi:hypothetical protein
MGVGSECEVQVRDLGADGWDSPSCMTRKVPDSSDRGGLYRHLSKLAAASRS